jgi:hypothetical protein
VVFSLVKDSICGVRNKEKDRKKKGISPTGSISLSSRGRAFRLEGEVCVSTTNRNFNGRIDKVEKGELNYEKNLK